MTWELPIDPDTAIHYRLDRRAVGDRLALSLALHDVPFRWAPGPVLVVRQEDQAAVEACLDFLATRDADGENEGAEAVDSAAAEAMEGVIGDLFVLADRLLHAPWDVAVLDRMSEMAALVERSDPAYGIEPTVWQEISSNATAIVTAGDRDDDLGVQLAARELRMFLREYV